MSKDTNIYCTQRHNSYCNVTLMICQIYDVFYLPAALQKYVGNTIHPWMEEIRSTGMLSRAEAPTHGAKQSL